MTALTDLIRSRRTIHTFLPDPPDVDVLKQAIEVACWAPNHKLTEPWRFHLLGPKKAAEIVQLNADLITAKKGAAAGEEKRRRWSEMPGWFVVSFRRDPDLFREEEDYAACCCAVQNLSLILWEQGLGLKWTTGIVQQPAFLQLLDLDAAHRVVGLFWYGKPATVPAQSRRPVTEVMKEWA